MGRESNADLMVVPRLLVLVLLADEWPEGGMEGQIWEKSHSALVGLGITNHEPVAGDVDGTTATAASKQ